MEHMKFEDTKPYADGFWKKNRINLVKDRISKIDFDGKSLHSESGNNYTYDKLLLATGATPNKFNWPGQDLNGVTGMYSFQDLERIERFSESVDSAVIVGGGLIGIELAEMLLSRKIKVSMLIREDGYWRNILPKADSDFIQGHILDHGVDLLLNEELGEILPNEYGGVREVVTKSGKRIDCQFVGLTAGVSPNVSFLRGSELEIDRGILVNRKLETSVNDVYAAGDCAQFENPPLGRARIEQVWYTGRLHGELAAINLLGGNMDYSPGPWFNSAKFFDLEYQTYGQVPSEPETDSSDFIFSNGKALVHVVYNSKSEEIRGVNLFGLRQRHEIWDHWLKEKIRMAQLVENIHKADFDPEFSQNFYSELKESYNAQKASKDLTI